MATIKETILLLISNFVFCFIFFLIPKLSNQLEKLLDILEYNRKIEKLEYKNNYLFNKCMLIIINMYLM